MADAGGGLLDIGLRNEVVDLYIVAERLEAMREALWDIKLATIGVREFERLPASVRRRARPDVDDHIPDGALETTHQLHLAVRLVLIVHAPHGAPTSGEGYAVLRIAGLEPVSRKLLYAESARKEAAAVTPMLQVNQPSALERRPMKLHELQSGLNFKTTLCGPPSGIGKNLTTHTAIYLQWRTSVHGDDRDFWKSELRSQLEVRSTINAPMWDAARTIETPG